MADFEVALILGILGTSFFLVYAASKLKGESYLLQIFKTFLVLASFANMIFVPTVGKYLVDANNGTNISTMVNSTWNPLYNTVGIQIDLYMWIFSSFMVMYTCYLMYLIVSTVMRWKKEKREGESDDD